MNHKIQMNRLVIWISAHIILMPPAMSAPSDATDADLARISNEIRIHPTAANFIERARLHSIKGEYGQAVEDDTQAIRLAPNIACYYAFRAVHYQSAKNHTAALADASKALSLANYGSDVYLHALEVRADCYEDLKQFDKAKADTLILVKLHDPGAQKALADINQELENSKRKIR